MFFKFALGSRILKAPIIAWCLIEEYSVCVGISGVLTDSVFVLMCVDVCLRLCLFVRNKAVVCQNFRNGDERKQFLHDILTKRRIISLVLVMAPD